MKKIGVLRFPGTNCDRDVFQFVKARNHWPEFLWHQDQFTLSDYQALIIPGALVMGITCARGPLPQEAQ